MKIRQGLTFDDVLLIPRYSEVKSRSEVDTSVDLGKGFKFALPIVSANMMNVTGLKMAQTLSNLGGLPIIHRFEDRLDRINKVYRVGTFNGLDKVGFSIGVGENEQDMARQLIDRGAKIICVDVAHGDHILTTDTVSFIAKNFPEVLLIAGNIATASGAQRLADAGADVIKVGIGGGSLCTTRIKTGAGVPQITALDECYRASCKEKDRKFKIISDGGVRRAGDLVKALCFSDMVMVGSMLAGTDEAPGDCLLVDNRLVKEYAGSSTHKTNHIEGVKAMVPYKGKVEPIITKTMEGVRSGLSYQGVDNLEDLKKVAEFVKITSAGLIESHPHQMRNL